MNISKSANETIFHFSTPFPIFSAQLSWKYVRKCLYSPFYFNPFDLTVKKSKNIFSFFLEEGGGFLNEPHAGHSSKCKFLVPKKKKREIMAKIDYFAEKITIFDKMEFISLKEALKIHKSKWKEDCFGRFFIILFSILNLFCDFVLQNIFLLF